MLLNIGVAFRVMEMLIETSDKNVKNITTEMLVSDNESLTDVSLTDLAIATKTFRNFMNYETESSSCIVGIGSIAFLS